MTVSDFIVKANTCLDAIYDQREKESVIRLVLEETLNISGHQLKLRLAEELSESAGLKLHDILKRLSRNEPVQYVLGFADFFGMKLKVNRSVLIPRPETEELVDCVIKFIKKLPEKKSYRLLDIGTGSGCIAIALKSNLPECSVTGIDVSRDALQVASENSVNRQCAIDFRNLDFLDEKQWETLGVFDVIVSNPPYVAQEELGGLDARVIDHEPRMALFASGDDPLIFYRKIAGFGKKHFERGGAIYLELNSAYAREIESIFNSYHYATSVKKDLQGMERILKAQPIIKQI